MPLVKNINELQPGDLVRWLGTSAYPFGLEVIVGELTHEQCRSMFAYRPSQHEKVLLTVGIRNNNLEPALIVTNDVDHDMLELVCRP